MGTSVDEMQQKNLNTETRQHEMSFSSEILDQLMDAVISVDNDSRVVYLNRAAAELYGVDRERSIGLKLTDLYESVWLKPEDAQLAYASLEEKGQWHGENVHVKKNGQRIFVDLKFNVVRETSGKKIGLMAVIRDVTERKKNEEEMQRERNFSQALSDNVYVPLAYLDNGFTITAVNRAFTVSSKLPAEELIGKNLFSVHPDEPTKRIFERVRSTGELVQYHDFPFEFPNQPERGVTFWDWTLTPVKDETGHAQGFVLTLLETTEIKKAQDAMHEAAENYEALFNNKGVGLTYCKVVMNENNEPIDFVLLNVNDTYEALTGLKKENVVGKKITEAIQGFAQTEIDWQNHVAMTGEPAHRELYEPYLKRWYDINVYSPRRGYFVSIFTDISDRKRTEESLRQNESLLHSFFDSPGMIRGIVEVIDGADVRHITCNSLAASFLGVPQEAIPNRLSSELGEPREIVSFWIERYELSRRSGQPVHFEYLDKRRDREIWLSVTVSYFGIDQSGQPRFGYVAADITESKKAEAEIDRLASFPELNPSPVIEMGFDGVVYYSNPAAESILPDLATSGLNHPFLSDFKNVVSALTVQKPSSGREVRVGGNWFYQRFYLVPEAQRVRVYAININELKQAENELRETRDYLDSLLNYANAPIIVWDPDFRITKFNHAFERLTGLNSNDAIGKQLDILFPKDRKEKALENIQRTLQGQYWEAVEIPIIRTDGTIRIALWNSANVCDPESKKIIATIAQGQDITERKKLEEKLKTSERMAGIGETAAMVGHDLRNPLQSIVGILDLAEVRLEEMSISSEQRQESRKRLESIRDQAFYMNKIVSDLQDYAGPVKTLPQRTDLRKLINDTLSASNVPESVSVSVNIPRNLPKVKIDATIVRRVVTNLVTNALQAMPNGGKLIIKVSRKRSPKTLIIYVEDTGLGISKADRSKIFQPLFTTKSRGQGLGLPVCKKLIEAHNGTIAFRSKVGKGSKFTVRIPLTETG